MVYGNLIDKNILADISICVTALGLILAMYTVISYINQVDTSKELQYLPHYNLYWFQQVFPSLILGQVSIYLFITKPQMRLALSLELNSKF